jgi:serine/threonine protein kinase
MKAFKSEATSSSSWASWMAVISRGRLGGRLFSEDEILRDFIEIALALKYVHDRRILQYIHEGWESQMR